MHQKSGPTSRVSFWLRRADLTSTAVYLVYPKPPHHAAWRGSQRRVFATGVLLGRRPRIARPQLPYLGGLTKFRFTDRALLVPSAEDRHELQQSCPVPDPFPITEGAADTRFDCRPSGGLFCGGGTRLPARRNQIEWV